MGLELKKIIEEISPPLLFRMLRRSFGKYRFLGNYSSWGEAERHSRGYDSNLILDKVRNALLKVRDGDAIYERDSVLFDEIEYSGPLLAALLWVASLHENRLNLVDFGGSLGSSYYQNRNFLSHLKELKWNIIEQTNFVECGRVYFENNHVKFYSDLQECRKEQNPDVILFLSVIQYLEKPYELLEEILGSEFNYVILNRTPFLEHGEDRITVQSVSSEIYEASYPAWFFNTSKFLDFFRSGGYEVVAEFDTADSSDMASSRFKGFIFKRVTEHAR